MNQTDKGILLVWGRKDKKQGWVGSSTACMSFCLKKADNGKLDLGSKYDVCMFSLWKLAFSGSHVTSPQGKEPIWSRLNQMGKSRVLAAADGSSGERSHRDPLSQTSLPCQKLWFFWGLTRWFVKLSDTAATGVWEKMGKWKLKLKVSCLVWWGCSNLSQP